MNSLTLVAAGRPWRPSLSDDASHGGT